MGDQAWFNALGAGSWVMVGNSLDGWNAVQIDRRTTTQVMSGGRRFTRSGEVGHHRTGIRPAAPGEMERDSALRSLGTAIRNVPKLDWRDRPEVYKSVPTEDIEKATDLLRQALALLGRGA